NPIMPERSGSWGAPRPAAPVLAGPGGVGSSVATSLFLGYPIVGKLDFSFGGPAIWQLGDGVSAGINPGRTDLPLVVVAICRPFCEGGFAMRKLWVFGILAFLLAVVPASAGPNVLTNGADLWHTTTGFSYSSFGDNPIPAGFFC